VLTLRHLKLKVYSLIDPVLVVKPLTRTAAGLLVFTDYRRGGINIITTLLIRLRLRQAAYPPNSSISVPLGYQIVTIYQLIQ
jgi:hypothetical protein